MARVAGDAKEEEEFDGLRCVLLDEANSGNAMRESRDEDKADTVTNTTKMVLHATMMKRFKIAELVVNLKALNSQVNFFLAGNVESLDDLVKEFVSADDNAKRQYIPNLRRKLTSTWVLLPDMAAST
ncbi:uncharacterized protein LOC111242308 isoform X3 [Vigna radiata var. radiata]|uniref:Uncharacterized protein LOC111242308 isoform X3 n=1 Tax=Vigna radiata var. radiata TaxID=3916 RepID=A0A3Q0F997_VIGRR|nr:uncharacterized protein LOC111242308 isoform X3 [Vigna radiata var. radiata]